MLYLDLHPHPVSVHFPIALTLASAAFLILHLVTGIESLVDGAYYALLGGAVVSPVTMLTGAVSWWFNYGHKLKSTFKGKAGLSVALFVTGVVTVVLWALNRDALLERETVGWIYFALVTGHVGPGAVAGEAGWRAGVSAEEETGPEALRRNGEIR